MRRCAGHVEAAPDHRLALAKFRMWVFRDAHGARRRALGRDPPRRGGAPVHWARTYDWRSLRGPPAAGLFVAGANPLRVLTARAPVPEEPRYGPQEVRCGLGQMVR